MNAAARDRQVDWQLEGLRREFAEVIPASNAREIGEKYYDRLREDARITDFIPVLV